MPNQTVMDIDQLLDRVKSYNADADLGIVRKAYEFSAKVHEGQRRRSGEPYLQHPIAVAGVLTSLKTDVTAIVAAVVGAGVTFAVLLLAVGMGSRLGHGTQAMVTRSMGLIVASMGMQFVLTGLKAFLTL